MSLSLRYPLTCPPLLITTSHSAVFVIMEGEGRLEIIQTTEYKNIEIIKFEFFSTSEDLVRKIITYRYNLEKSRLEVMQGRF